MRLWMLVALSALPAAFAQSNVYQFSIDQDRLAGAPDFSFLNRPLTAADRLFVRDGHFFRVGPDLAPGTADDQRVRLFGVNLAFSANFPEQRDAPRIAARLRRLGVNLVRLHHMDTSPDSNPNNAGSILTTGPYPTLNPVAVERLRVFLDALKAEGIYINLNLHVGYAFRPSVDMVPAHPAFPTQSKPLHNFHPRMVELETEFTRKVLSALKLKDDPVLAMVEISNEDSMLRAWQTGNLDRHLVGEYQTILEGQWNSYLRGRYSSTDALRTAWGRSEPDGPELLPGKWVLEKGAPSDGVYQITAEGDVPVLRMEVTQQGPRLILKQVGFSVEEGQPYLAAVEMRIEAPPGVTRSIYWDVKQDVNPWRTLRGTTVTVTHEWKKFTMPIQAAFGMEGIGRFGLAIERLDVPLYVRGWSLHRLGRKGLEDSETLEAGNLPLVREEEAATQPRTDDYLLFLAETDRAYLNSMLRAVRETTDSRVPVAGTQMGYGGLMNLDSHSDLDYQDHHFYIDHYNFPNVSWDGRDWRIRDSSSVGSDLATFLNIAAAREAGRPYTVSEFNQPWPNRQAAEIDPTLAAFGAFQDWDSIMHFAYSHGRGWDDGVPNGFNINGDWTRFPNVGQSAWLFRSGAIQPGREVIDLPVSREARLRATREKRNGNIAAFLAASADYRPAVALVHRVQLVKDGAGEAPAAARQPPPAPYRSDTDEMTYDPSARVFLVHAPKAAGVFGFVQRQKTAAGAISVELTGEARGFVTLLVTTLDDAPIEDSGRLLVSLPGYTLRTQPSSNPPRPQEMVLYGATTDWWTLEAEPNYPNKPSGHYNSGVRPVWMERVECFLTLRTTARRLTVYPLDGAGGRLAPLGSADVAAVEGGFQIHLQGEGQSLSPWYEILAER